MDSDSDPDSDLAKTMKRKIYSRITLIYLMNNEDNRTYACSKGVPSCLMLVV